MRVDLNWSWAREYRLLMNVTNACHGCGTV
jgi:hypothetical protein